MVLLTNFPIRRVVRLLAAVALLLGAWAGLATAAEVQVPVVSIGKQPVGQGLELEGTLQAVKQSTLSAQTSGRILQLTVKAGDRVRAGQVLAVVDDRLAVAGVSQAQAQVAQADANLTNARAQVERTRDLHAKGFVSRSALDQAEAQYQSAEAGASGAKAGQTQSQVAQGFTRIAAPFDGWVLGTHAESGDLAMPGSPVVTVYAPQPIRAVTHVPATRQTQAQKAGAVEVKLPDGQWIQPTTRTMLPAADPVSQTVEWRLDLPPQSAAGLLPGQQVQVRFVSGQSDKLTVPSEAVFRRGELSAVYVVTGQGGAEAFALRAVRLGAGHGSAGG